MRLPLARGPPDPLLSQPYSISRRAGPHIAAAYSLAPPGRLKRVLDKAHLHLVHTVTVSQDFTKWLLQRRTGTVLYRHRLRAGAGRRSGSGWRQGRVCSGRPLLSRPRGAVGFGLAAVESAAASVVALTSDVRGVCCWWVWLVVRFVCVPLCVRVFRVSRVCPGSPRCLFTGICLPLAT
jgi:hypothetical protein